MAIKYISEMDPGWLGGVPKDCVILRPLGTQRTHTWSCLIPEGHDFIKLWWVNYKQIGLDMHA